MAIENGGGPLDPKVRASLERYAGHTNVLSKRLQSWVQVLIAAEQYERLRADAALEAFDAAQKQTCLAEDRAYDRKTELEKEREQKAELLEACKALLATGLNGGNDVRLAFLAASGRALDDEDLQRGEDADRALALARAAIRKAEGAQ